LNSITWFFGVAAGVLTTVSWMPQVVKSWKSRSAGDFSWAYLAMFSAGVGSWEIYGLLRRDAIIIAANLVTLLLIFVVMYVKAKEEWSRG
jgi:MtN3 and saliva related transmembrane protein